MNNLVNKVKNSAPIRRYRQLSVVAKATLWFLACSIIQKSVSLISTPIFTRLMTKEQYGVYGVYLSWLQILTIFVTFRLDFGVFNKGMSKFPEDRDGYASSMMGLTTVLTSIVLVLYIIFMKQVNAFTELSTPIMVGMIVEIYGASAVSFWSLRERYDFRYKQVVFVTLLTALVNVVLGVAAVLIFEEKGTARVLSCVVAQLLVGMVIYFRLFFKGRTFIHVPYVKYAVLFNIPLIPYYFSTYIVEQSDRIMIQKMISMDAAALYNVAYTLGGIIRIVSNAISNALIPMQYRRLEKKEHEAIRKNLFEVMCIVLCVVEVFTCVAPELIWIMGGDAYYEAVYVIPPVSASVFFAFLTTMLANIEFYFDKNRFATYISFAGAAVNLILNFLLIPVVGYVAAAYTTLVSYIIFAVGHLLYCDSVARKNLGHSVADNRQMILLGIFATVSSAVLSVLYRFTILRYGLLAAIAVIAVLKRRQLMQILKKMKK